MDSNKIQYVKNFILFALLVGIGAAISGMSQLYIFGLSIFMILMIYAVQNPDEIFDSSNSMYKSLLFESVLNDFNRGKEFKVIFVRVPDVDLYQESFGEEQSNQILAQVVYFLKSIHSSSHVYRVDSRTFAVKLVNVDDIKLNALCKKIIARFAEEYKVGNNSHIFNVGLVTMSCPEDAANLSSFRKICAHLTRSIIKIDSQLTISKFLEEDKENEIIEAIKKALDNNTFRVFYQPIYSTEKKKIVAAEALLRLFDDKLGFISPELFIPIAEREGFILKIGKYVFTEVCKYYSANKLDEKGIEYIEVNLSAVQCMQYKLAEEFMAIMKNYNMKPSQVNFEITESSAMISNSAVSLNIDYFIKSGVELSLDDYGTGYSNISYLYNLPFALMKIDKGILWSADKNRKANITLENIFSMAKDLKMRIVVEGVETEEQIKKLLKLNCDYFQGYYFSKPICEKDFLVYLDNFEVPVVCKAV